MIKVEQISVECDVSAKILTEIIKLAPSVFFLEICDIDKNDKLVELIMNFHQPYATLITENQNTDIIVAANNDLLNNIADLLFKSLSETIVIYFPSDNVTFQQFLYNREPHSNIPQKYTIKKGLCNMICTWVTNENRLYFHFDNYKGNEMFEQIHRHITGKISN